MENWGFPDLVKRSPPLVNPLDARYGKNFPDLPLFGPPPPPPPPPGCFDPPAHMSREFFEERMENWVFPDLVTRLPPLVNPLDEIYGKNFPDFRPPPPPPRPPSPPPPGCFDPAHMSRECFEERREWLDRFYATEGFDVPPLPKGLDPNSDMLPFEDLEFLKNLASFAILDYNAKNATNYSFVSVVKGYTRFNSGFQFLITFVAQAADADHREIFQAKVADSFGTRFPYAVLICRPKPT